MNNALAVTKRVLAPWSCTASRTSLLQSRSLSPDQSFGGRYGRRFLMSGPTCRALRSLNSILPISKGPGSSQSWKQHVRGLATPSETPEQSEARGVPNASSRIQPMTPAEVAKVFGRRLDAKTGNSLLQVLQKRRFDGMLDLAITNKGVTPHMVERGLEYLRARYPIDEEAAIIRRVEKEEEFKEQEALMEIEKARQWRPQESAKEDGLYGKSNVDESVKLYNEAQKKDREAREERRRKEIENTEVIYEEEHAKVGNEIQRKISEVHIIPVGNTKVRKVVSTSYAPLTKDVKVQVKQLSQIAAEPALVQAPNGTIALRKHEDWINSEEKWWHKYQKRAYLTDWDGVSEPPYMPVWRRWGLPTMFMLLTVGASILFGQYYKPPQKPARMFPDIPPAAATIGVIISMNVFIWLAWKFPPMWRFLNKNFLLHAVIPKSFQLLGSTYSHQQFSHLAMNMALLWFVGQYLHDQVGRGEFLALYIGGGVFASWVSLTHFLVSKQILQSTLGASGAICALVACYLRINDGRRFEFWLWPGEKKPSFQPEQFLMILIFMEVIGILAYMRSKNNQFDHFAHIGGYIAGFAGAELMKRKRSGRKGPLVRQRETGYMVERGRRSS